MSKSDHSSNLSETVPNKSEALKIDGFKDLLHATNCLMEFCSVSQRTARFVDVHAVCFIRDTVELLTSPVSKNFLQFDQFCLLPCLLNFQALQWYCKVSMYICDVIGNISTILKQCLYNQSCLLIFWDFQLVSNFSLMACL